MTTPERALELAENLEAKYRVADSLIHRCKSGLELDDLIGPVAHNPEIAAILRHYAEIMQADPVAYGLTNTAITGNPHALMVLAIEIPPNDQYGGALWHPLIIKPAP